MINEKRGTWWATDPKKGKKGFATEQEAKTWAAGGAEKSQPKEEKDKEEE